MHPAAEEESAARPRLSEDLPVSERTVVISEKGRANPDAYRQIGEQVIKRLSVAPPRSSMEISIRPTFVRRGVECATPFNAPLPPCLLEGCILSQSRMVHS